MRERLHQFMYCPRFLLWPLTHFFFSSKVQIDTALYQFDLVAISRTWIENTYIDHRSTLANHLMVVLLLHDTPFHSPWPCDDEWMQRSSKTTPTTVINHKSLSRPSTKGGLTARQSLNVDGLRIYPIDPISDKWRYNELLPPLLPPPDKQLFPSSQLMCS